jgi:hypothetical protein
MRDTWPAITLAALLGAARVVTDGARWWIQNERGDRVEATSPFPAVSDLAGE